MVYMPGLKGQEIRLRRRTMASEKKIQIISVRKPAFMSWTIGRILRGMLRHPLLVILTLGLVSSMGLEYNIPMVKAGEEPVDLGFLLTAPVFRFMKQRPTLHNILAAANTVRLSLTRRCDAYTFGIRCFADCCWVARTVTMNTHH